MPCGNGRLAFSYNLMQGCRPYSLCRHLCNKKNDGVDIYMPMKPKKPCKHPGCPELTAGQYCNLHAGEYERRRGSSSSRGYDYRWQAARRRFLKLHPLCVECYKTGRYIEATVVDHVTPHRGDQHLFWDESNWQALCQQCHNRKTRTYDQRPEYKY